MKDMQLHLEKRRTQADECEMIRNLATDKTKQELFAKLTSTSRCWPLKSNAR